MRGEGGDEQNELEQGGETCRFPHAQLFAFFLSSNTLNKVLFICFCVERAAVRFIITVVNAPRKDSTGKDSLFDQCQPRPTIDECLVNFPAD